MTCGNTIMGGVIAMPGSTTAGPHGSAATGIASMNIQTV